MMRIDAGDCLNLTPVGYPAAITNGEFPVSVTFSSAIMTACVACSGALDGVSCFSVDSQAGLTLLDDTPRRFNLEQTTPPVGPFNTVSDILFNGDSTALMVSVKGDPPNNNTGFLARYPINPETGLVGAEETMQTFSPSGTAVLFGFSNVVDDGDDENDTIVITDASFGAAVLPLPVISAASVAGPQVQELSFRTPIDNQTATCWSTYNPQTSTFYVTDVAQARLVEIDAADGAILKDLTLENSLNPGMIDLLHHNSGFVYSLNPSANGTTAINVFDVRGGPGQFIEVQSLAIEGVQATGRAMGMMLFPRMGAMMTGSD